MIKIIISLYDGNDFVKFWQNDYNFQVTGGNLKMITGKLNIREAKNSILFTSFSFLNNNTKGNFSIDSFAA